MDPNQVSLFKIHRCNIKKLVDSLDWPSLFYKRQFFALLCAKGRDYAERKVMLKVNFINIWCAQVFRTKNSHIKCWCHWPPWSQSYNFFLFFVFRFLLLGDNINRAIAVFCDFHLVIFSKWEVWNVIILSSW